MWACLADQDTTGHWRQVAAWRKICDLAQTHLGRLQEYRRGLAEAWPPETNEASRAYLAELDQLIEKVRRTHDAAATNYTALSAATQAIGTTREALRKIHDEYAAKAQQKRAYDATVADPKAIMGNRTTEPPVTDDELERLNVRARGIMYGLSSELQQAQVMLRQPPPARPPAQDQNPDIYGNPGSAVPVIPPIVAVPLSPGRAPVSEKVQSPAKPVAASTAPALGPILGGAAAGTAPAPSTPSPSVGVPSLPAGGLQPPIAPGVASRPGLPIRPGQVSPPGTKGAGSVPTSPPQSPPARPLPPGGLIGGVPGSGLTQPVSGNGQPRRVNPIGGVIGGGGAGTAPTGAAGSRPGGGRTGSTMGHMPPFGSAPQSPTFGAASGGGPRIVGSTRRGSEPEDGQHPKRWNPDEPWTTEQGVAPIVLPPDEDGPIDPGPAIGFKR
ncbi:hypothetical protein JD76_04174 [Micromonospora endolithica]|nr:hypothetical protein JD76_04174 [Micromonospora endolithica]